MRTGLILFLATGLAQEAAADHRVTPVTPATPGRTGFTLLNSAQTGIRFTNTLSLEAAAKNHNLMQSAGVAAGDFDSDGLCDLYFCTVEGRNALYRNLGNFQFADVTAATGAATTNLFSTGAIFADVNGDGWLDLLVAANNGGPTLLMNTGRGQFTNATAASGLVTRPLGGTSLALGDLDGNGTLDLFVANYGENTILRSGGNLSVRTVNGQPVVSGRDARRWKIINGRIIEFGEPSAVYLNDGAGKFTPLSWTGGAFRDEDGQLLKQQPMDLSLSVLVRDINGDGAPDIYVCNDFQTPDRIWLNDGKANFRAMPRLAVRQTCNFSMGVDFADLDRDGRDDFLVVDMLSRLHSLRMTQMTETNLTPARPGEFENRPQIRRNTLFWNRDDGTYAEIANFAGLDASDWSWTPAFLDVDLDGYEDVLVSNGHARDTQDLDATQMKADKRPGAAQLLTQFPLLETPNYAFRNRGDLTFEEVGAAWGFNSKQVCHGIVFADLDNDGDLDMAVSSLNAPPLVYRNESAAPRVAVRLRGLAPNTRGLGAKIIVRGGAVPEQSQQMVAGGRYLSADEPVRMFAAGALANKLTIEVTWRSGAVSVVSNVPANSICEVDERGAVQSSKFKVQSSKFTPLFTDASALLNHRHHEEAFDDFARQPLLTRKFSQLGPGAAWLDLDGDGRDELIIGSGRGGALTVAKSNGPNAFTKTEQPGLATDDLLGLSAWAKDGKRALLIARANYEDASAAALLQHRAGAVTPLPLAMKTGSPGPVAVADTDGNGTLEIFVGARVVAGRYPEPGESVLLGRAPAHQAADQALLKNLGPVSSAVWSDLEGDGFPELIVACEWSSLKIFRNQRGTLTAWDPKLLTPHSSPLTFHQLTGWWTSVTTGDFDGDGRLDLVAGNWGLNSSHRATPASPLRLYHGDLAGDGSAPLIEAEFDAVLKKFLPRENLTLLAPAMPFLRARFPTYAALRNTSVTDALGERAGAAKQLEVNTLGSMLFLNRGDHFEARPLPREAQWSPVMGVSVADADGDGADDVFLAQNFFATRDDVPRLDAGRGLWLRNDGKGNFAPLRAEESGVQIWGEQRGCAVGDFDHDGRVDLVVAQNAGETKLFHNTGARPGLRVRLRGPAENPDGLGAVVRLKQASGLGPTREIHGGSGCFSQDSVVAVLGQSTPPTHVLVRWPGGKTSEVPVPAGANEIIVEFPK